MRVLVATLVLLWSFSPLVAGEKQDDIRQFLTLSGAKENGMQMLNNMLDQFKKMLPQVPEKFWVEFLKEIDPDDLVELTVPVYDKYLTHDDVKGLVKFYKSDVGKKFSSVQPMILQESMTAGQKWGEQIGTKLQKRLSAEGYGQ